MSVTSPTTQTIGTCPCDANCGVVGTKLTRAGHLVGCGCRPCLGKRSRAKGQRKQSGVLKAAARAQGTTMDIAPTHEEQARLLVHYEVKAGAQIPKAFFGGWMRHATEQASNFAERQVPARKWALVLEPDGRDDALILMPFKQWLVLVAELTELP